MLEPHHLNDKMKLIVIMGVLYSAESDIWEDGAELCQPLFFEG